MAPTDDDRNEVTEVSAADLQAQQQGGDVELSAQPRALQKYFVDNFPTTAFDPALVQRSIVENILSTGAAEILDLAESLDSAKIVQNRPMRFDGVSSVMPSDYGGIYLICDVVLIDTGEAKQISIGSPTILAQLEVIYENDRKVAAGEIEGEKMLPLECKIAPIRRGGKNGHNPPLYLRKLTY